MSEIVAIGDPGRLAGFALAGVEVHPATTADEAVAAWGALDTDAGLVVLDADAAAAVADIARPDRLLTVVVP